MRREDYGFHRVIRPMGVIPQAAEALVNTPSILDPSEVLVEVDALQLDSTSMRQLVQDGDPANAIRTIVEARGKMHNPVTNSGGVLLGRVKAIGDQRKDFNLNVGDPIIPLTSVTTIPLQLTEVGEIHGDRVVVKGTAVLFRSYPYSGIPKGFTPEAALAALDISSLVPQVKRVMNFDNCGCCSSERFLIIGCGKAGITAAALIRRLGGPETKIFVIDASDRQLGILKSLNYANCVPLGKQCLAKIDATNAEAVLNFAVEATDGEGFDVVLNVVNVRNTEAGTLLAVKPGGTVIFFSMATSFQQAVLATDGTGKDANIILGNGVAERQADQMFWLLQQDRILRYYFEHLHD